VFAVVLDLFKQVVLAQGVVHEFVEFVLEFQEIQFNVVLELVDDEFNPELARTLAEDVALAVAVEYPLVEVLQDLFVVLQDLGHADQRLRLHALHQVGEELEDNALHLVILEILFYLLQKQVLLIAVTLVLNDVHQLAFGFIVDFQWFFEHSQHLLADFIQILLLTLIKCFFCFDV